MITKHKKGTWSVYFDGHVSTITCNGEVIVDDSNARNAGVGNDEEATANATLIAAAPRLLQACMMMLDPECDKLLAELEMQDAVRAALGEEDKPATYHPVIDSLNLGDEHEK
jgi:hypothetical protein